MNLLLAGDTHGNNGWMSRLVEYATKNRCAAIMQLGDFGYWEHTAEGREFLDKTSRKLLRAGIVLYFIDGNHENHPMLWGLYKPNEDGFCEVRPNLFYVPRGTRWEWDGVSFLGVGGAYSIDKKWRLRTEESRRAPRTLWWPTETISQADFTKSTSHGTVDVLFAHDCPWGVDLPGIRGEFPESNENRMMLREIVAATQPRLLVHGHYHMRNSDMLELPIDANDDGLVWHSTQIEGLHCDGAWNHDAWVVFNTDRITGRELLAA